MRILVTGSNGMLGSSVKEVFTNHDLILTDSTNCDVRNIQQVMSYANNKLGIVLHLAAETDLNKAKMNPNDAYKINHSGTQNMIILAEKLNIPIVYISTAMIFDGTKKIYDEKDKANPTNHYGRSKYYGEIAVKSYKKHYIVRSGWAFGGGPDIDKKFIDKIYKQIKGGAKKLYGIKDIYGNPTFTMDFANTLKNIIENQAEYGIYNSPGKGVASRFEVLKAFVGYMGLTKKIELIDLTVNEYRKMFNANFPFIKNEVLSINKLEKKGLSSMRDWREALKEYTKEYSI